MPTRQPILPLEGTDRRVYGALQAIMALLALGYIGFAIYRYVSDGTVVGSDFPFFWVAAHIESLEDLKLAYTGKLFSLEAATERWGDTIQGRYWAYPPHFILFLRPLSALSYGAAFVVWNVVSLVFFAAVVWATFGRSWRLVGFTALAPAALFCLWLGQTGLIMAALLVGGIGWLWRRPVLAGILLGLLTCKPPLGLLVPFALVAGGHWRAFVSACLTAGVLILASLALRPRGLDRLSGEPAGPASGPPGGGGRDHRQPLADDSHGRQAARFGRRYPVRPAGFGGGGRARLRHVGLSRWPGSRLVLRLAVRRHHARFAFLAVLRHSPCGCCCRTCCEPAPRPENARSPP
jgi:hypothetical protein